MDRETERLLGFMLTVVEPDAAASDLEEFLALTNDDDVRQITEALYRDADSSAVMRLMWLDEVVRSDRRGLAPWLEELAEPVAGAGWAGAFEKMRAHLSGDREEA